LVDIGALSNFLEALRVFEEVLAAHDVGLEDDRLEGLGAASAFDLKGLFVGIFDTAKDLDTLFGIVKLLGKVLHLFGEALIVFLCPFHPVGIALTKLRDNLISLKQFFV